MLRAQPKSSINHSEHVADSLFDCPALCTAPKWSPFIMKGVGCDDTTGTNSAHSVSDTVRYMCTVLCRVMENTVISAVLEGDVVTRSAKWTLQPVQVSRNMHLFAQ